MVPSFTFDVSLELMGTRFTFDVSLKLMGPRFTFYMSLESRGPRFTFDVSLELRTVLARRLLLKGPGGGHILAHSKSV